MNILVLNWRDIKHPLAGGAEISTHEHAKGWVKKGHKVIFFSSSFPGAKRNDIIDGIRIIRYGSYYTVHLCAWWYYIRVLRGSIDLVVDEFHFIPFFTPLYVKQKKLAFIHETAEQVWFKNKPFPIGFIGFILEPLFFKLYQHIDFMTVSKSTKIDLLKFGVKEKNIYVISNGISKKIIHKDKEKKPTIIYLGRLSDDKGTIDAIHAFKTFQEFIPESVMWIVGKEEHIGYKKKILYLIDALHLNEKVKFFGFVNEEKKYELLKCAWVLIHPSVREGWGLTVIEAASQGTPTVAFETAGLMDSILHKKTGLLINNRNPRELGRTLAELCTNQRFYAKMSRSAIDWAKKFKWDSSVDQSLALIEHI